MRTLADGTSEIKLILSGNAEGATQSLAEVGKAMSGLLENLTNFSKTALDVGKAMTDFASSVGRGVTAANADMGSMSKTAGDVSKSIEGLTKTTQAQTKAMDISFEELAKVVQDSGVGIVSEIDTVNRTVVEMAGQFAQSSAESIKQMQAMTQEMKAVGVSVDEMAAKSSQSGEKMSKAIDYAGLMIAGQQLMDFGKKVVGFFAKSVEAGATFDQTLANTRAALDSQAGSVKVTNDQMKVMQELFLQIGQTGFYSANQVGEAASTLAKNGLNFNAITRGAIQQTAEIAAANQQDLDQTATTVSDIYNEMGSAIVQQFHGNVANAFEYIGGVMTRTLHSSKISMQNLFDTLKYSASTASAAGVSFADLGAIVSLLGSHAIRASQAGTSIRRMLTNLTPSTKAATAMMEQLGYVTKSGGNVFYDASGKMKSLVDVQRLLHDGLAKLSPEMQTFALKTLFGQYSLAAMSTVVNESPAAFQKLAASMNQTGATMQALSDRQQGWQYTWMRLQAEFQTIEKEIGMMLKPVVDKLSAALQGLMNWWDRLSPATQKVIIGFTGALGVLALVGGAIMTVIASVGFLVMGLEAAGAAFAAVSSFALPVTAVLAAVGVAAYLLVTHWNTVKAVTLDVFNAIRNVVLTVWGFVGPYIISGIQAVRQWWMQIWPELSEVLKVVFTVVKALVVTTLLPTFVMIKLALSILAATWRDIWGVIQNTLKLVWDACVTIVRIAWHLISGEIQIFLDLVTGRWSKAWSDTRQVGLNLWNDIKDGIGKIVGDLKNIVIDTIKGMVDGVLGEFNGLVSMAENAWNKIKSIFSSPIKGPSVSTGGVSGSGIPKYAEGGWVTKPSLIFAGEREPELVLPKSKMNDLSFLSQFAVPNSNPLPAARGSGGFGRQVTIGQIVVNTQAKDGFSVARELKKHLNFVLR